MAERPRIGVTGNGRGWAPSWWCTAFALRLVGATPVRISVHHSTDEAALSGIIIGGGDDIGPEQYGGVVDVEVKLDPARDELEIRWIKEALARDMPVMGICRGAQLINVVLGGSLHQNIRHLRKRTRNRPSLLPTKHVDLSEDSLIRQVSKKKALRVNSLHHQAIDSPGDYLRIVGRDRDTICQAVEYEQGRSMIGVQWHPEYLFYVPAQLRLFRWLAVNAKTATGERHE